MTLKVSSLRETMADLRLGDKERASTWPFTRIQGHQRQVQALMAYQRSSKIFDSEEAYTLRVYEGQLEEFVAARGPLTPCLDLDEVWLLRDIASVIVHCRELLPALPASERA